MCVSHHRSEEMLTPKYFAEDKDSSMQLWRVYCVCIGFFGPCYVNDLAFREVKLHVQFITPAFKVFKIFLENLWLGRCWDGQIKSNVMCKESHFGFDIHRKIIYVLEKIRKRNGPSTDPWGTPNETGIGSDEDPFTMTDCQAGTTTLYQHWYINVETWLKYGCIWKMHWRCDFNVDTTLKCGLN